MNDMAGLWAHRQLQARQRWRTVGRPAGDVPAPLPPCRSERWEARMGAIPKVGEHTETLLHEAGLDRAAIDALTCSAVHDAGLWAAAPRPINHDIRGASPPGFGRNPVTKTP